jgi:hypothetical protein
MPTNHLDNIDRANLRWKNKLLIIFMLTLYNSHAGCMLQGCHWLEITPLQSISMSKVYGQINILQTSYLVEMTPKL